MPVTDQQNRVTVTPARALEVGDRLKSAFKQTSKKPENLNAQPGALGNAHRSEVGAISQINQVGIVADRQQHVQLHNVVNIW